MKLSDEYNIIYERHSKKIGCIDGMYTEDNYLGLCKAHKKLKEENEANKEILKKYIDSETYKIMMASMLGELKQILTDKKEIEINL